MSIVAQKRLIIAIVILSEIVVHEVDDNAVEGSLSSAPQSAGKEFLRSRCPLYAPIPGLL
jgi:hypothetical protein